MIYRQRREVLENDDLSEIIDDMLVDLAAKVAVDFAHERQASEDWDWAGLSERMQDTFHFPFALAGEQRIGLNADSLRDLLNEQVRVAYQIRVEKNSVAGQRHLERIILLQMVDNHWKEHLLSMDHLKEGIGLRGYGQKNPLIEYKREGFQMFMNTMETVKQQTVSALMRVELVQEGDAQRLEEERRRKREEELRLSRLLAPGLEPEPQQPAKREGDKIGRNADCPCGSGKKYKRCCGKLS